MTYDDRSLPRSTSGPMGNSTLTYTADGNLAARVDAAGTTNYTYDTLGRPATTANMAAGVAMTYGYNSVSQVTDIGYGSGADHRVLGYDALHRLTSDDLRTTGTPGTSIAKIAYEYDPNDNVTKTTTSRRRRRRASRVPPRPGDSSTPDESTRGESTRDESTRSEATRGEAAHSTACHDRSRA